MSLVGLSGICTGALCFNALWWTGSNGMDYSHAVDNELWREASGKLPAFVAADAVSKSKKDICDELG